MVVKPARKLSSNKETLCERNFRARKFKFEMDEQEALLVTRGKIEVGDDVIVSCEVKLPEGEDETGLANVTEDANETQDENSDKEEESGDQSEKILRELGWGNWILVYVDPAKFWGLQLKKTLTFIEL